MSKIKILGVGLDNLSMSQALKKVEILLEDERQHYLTTPNPELLVEAQKDIQFKKILNQADLAVADGIGLVFASWFLGQPLKRIPGADLMEKICQKASLKKYPVFLLGAGPGVSQKAALNLKKKYPGLLVEAIDNKGIADLKIVAEAVLKKSHQPGILFLALGAPRQEKWIWQNLAKIKGLNLALGIGGSLDFLGGRLPRAPGFLRRLGLEWLWRFLYEPWRAKRIFKAVVVFPGLVVLGLLRRNKGY